MENKEFFINKDGFKLHAKMAFPKGDAEKFPMVILVHGLTGHMEEPHIIGISDTIVEAGYISLRVELYGHGQSDGAFENHNLLEWISELCYVIDYARNLSFVSDIILSGHSQGGLATVLTAGLKANQLKAIMPLSPALCIRDQCLNGDFFGSKFDSKNIPDWLQFWEDKCVTGNYVRIGQCLPIEQAIDAYKGTVLIVQGTNDGAVPFEDSKKAASCYENAKIELIEGDGHCYEFGLEQVKKVIKDFLVALNND